MKTRSITAALSAGLALTLPAIAAAQTINIPSATVVTADGKSETKQAVTLVDGRLQFGPAAATDDLDTDIWVTPGIIASFSHLGLVEVSAESATNDISAHDSQFSISQRAADNFNPRSTVIPVTRMEGVTHAVVAPGRNADIFGGLGAVVDTSGRLGGPMVEDAFVYVALGRSGANAAGGSRGAALDYLRTALADAAAPASRRNAERDSGDAISRREAASLARVLSGDIPLVVSADRAVDIINVTKLTRKYSRLRLIIEGCNECSDPIVMKALLDTKTSVLIDPQENLPSSFDQVGARNDAVVKLIRAGVPTALTARSSEYTHNVRLLPQHAGNAVAYGLTWDEAFTAITRTPAQIFGLGPNAGTLQDGGTFVIWNGDPLDVMSAPVAVYIDGVRQDMMSRQSELARRYNPVSTDERQFKYRD